MITILVTLLGITAEVELPTVRLDAEPDGREGQVEDAGQGAGGVVDTMLTNERWQVRRP